MATVTGGSGKTFSVNSKTGAITVTYADGTSVNKTPGQEGYAATNKAMQADTGLSYEQVKTKTSSAAVPASPAAASSSSSASKASSAGAAPTAAGAGAAASGSVSGKTAVSPSTAGFDALKNTLSGATSAVKNILGVGAASSASPSEIGLANVWRNPSVPTAANQGNLGYGSLQGKGNFISRELNSKTTPVYENDPKFQAMVDEYTRRYGIDPFSAPAYEEEAPAAVQQQMPYQQEYPAVDLTAMQQNTLSFDEAQSLARQYSSGLYQGVENAALIASQNLERAGIYDSVYGQALSAETQAAASMQMEQQINELAQWLMSIDRDSALEWARLNLSQNQSAADYSLNRDVAEKDYALKSLQLILNQANANRDYTLAAEVQRIEAELAANQISASDAQIEIARLQSERDYNIDLINANAYASQ
jgi:hypothetical protein